MLMLSQLSEKKQNPDFMNNDKSNKNTHCKNNETNKSKDGKKNIQ